MRFDNNSICFNDFFLTVSGGDDEYSEEERAFEYLNRAPTRMYTVSSATHPREPPAQLLPVARYSYTCDRTVIHSHWLKNLFPNRIRIRSRNFSSLAFHPENLTSRMHFSSRANVSFFISAHARMHGDMWKCIAFSHCFPDALIYLGPTFRRPAKFATRTNATLRNGPERSCRVSAKLFN